MSGSKEKSRKRHRRRELASRILKVVVNDQVVVVNLERMFGKQGRVTSVNQMDKQVRVRLEGYDTEFDFKITEVQLLSTILEATGKL